MLKQIERGGGFISDTWSRQTRKWVAFHVVTPILSCFARSLNINYPITWYNYGFGTNQHGTDVSAQYTTHEHEGWNGSVTLHALRNACTVLWHFWTWTHHTAMVVTILSFEEHRRNGCICRQQSTHSNNCFDYVLPWIPDRSYNLHTNINEHANMLCIDYVHSIPAVHTWQVVPPMVFRPDPAKQLLAWPANASRMILQAVGSFPLRGITPCGILIWSVSYICN